MSKNLNAFLLIIFLSIPAIWALFVPGFYGASDDLHIAWLHQMDTSLKMGQYPPRFVPDLSFGFGYPLFNFVFPLPFYLAELFHLFGLSFVDSIKAVFLISVPLSGFFMFRFLKEYSSFWLALAGAILYIYTPYRATDIYVRGAIGEIFAFIFPPLIAWAITKRNVSVLALSTAGLILSHNIMAYMFLPFFAIFAFVIGLSKKHFYGFLLGLLISIYFWLPAVTESKLMKYDTVFNFVDHFPTIKQLVTPHFGYGASVAGPYDGMSFFMGTINLMLAVLAVIFYRKLNKVSIWVIGIIGISIFMMNYRSTILWRTLPLIPFFQFPWRFLSLTTFATAILVIVLDKFKYSKQIGMFAIVAVIALNFSYFKPHDFLERKDDYYLNKYIPTPIASDEYLKTGEEYLRLPIGTEVRPNKRSPYMGLDNSFEVDYKEETIFDYQKYYFPGWIVKIDGKKSDIKVGEPYGQIQFRVPSGEHKVEIYFGETKFRMFLNIISLLSLLIVIKMFFGSHK